MINTLTASIKKELILLSRDLHALLILFVMPLAFVLVMSLALQDQINGQSSIVLEGRVTVTQGSVLSDLFLEELTKISQIKISNNGAGLFELHLTQGFDQAVLDEFDGTAVALLEFGTELGQRERMLVFAAVKEAFSIVNVHQLAEELDFDEEYIQSNMLKDGAVAVFENTQTQSIPINSTQQSVPAWLVFAMFFVSLPISTVVIAERRQKSLLRLRTMGVSPVLWLTAKLLPYFVINLLQLLFLLGVGVMVLPLFGGVALSLNVSWIALFSIAAAVSIAALGFAAFIACLSKTVEQATILAGTSNILFGALGGIMVPSFVMPQFMRWVTQLSPMGWGLDGFIAVLVRGETVSTIWIEVSVLIGFGSVMILLALWQLKNSIRWEA